MQSIMGIGEAVVIGFYCPDQPIPVMEKLKQQEHYCLLGRFLREIWTRCAAVICVCVRSMQMTFRDLILLIW